MRDFEYFEPKSVAEACSILSEHEGEAKVLAGGQSLLVLMKERVYSPKYVVDLKGVVGLDEISRSNGQLQIGALATHRAVELSPLVKERCPSLATVASRIGALQIRNRGTIGGSVCHADPAGDWAPVLIALGAQGRAVSSKGEKTVSFEDFATDYYANALASDEILVEIRVPAGASCPQAAYEKFSLREGEMAMAGVAVALTMEGQICKEARVVLAAAGPRPIRATQAEQALSGNTVDSRAIAAAATLVREVAKPVGDIRGSEAYKKEILATLTKRAIASALR
ncbi:MAG: xanthine dehydrogenase family protein subunit M [Chloroflexi bacterium]|nr:xanthine dehydrogenase family protein subunit M [Chloroflexota bacterium]